MNLIFILILISSNDFFLAYISIEGISLILYLLAAIINNNLVSKEAAFKYLALGSLSSGFFLLGLS
jgi:NADH-quinone oxidoreductase subunit N